MLMCSDGISADLIQGKEKEFADEFLKDLNRENTTQDKRVYIQKTVDNWPVPKHSDDKTIVVMETEKCIKLNY